MACHPESEDPVRVTARAVAAASLVRVPSESIVVLDLGSEVSFSFDDMLRYNGRGSPGGVAQAFKVLERALPLLGPNGLLERREITIETPFGGPGARDAFELVTHAVTEGRFILDRSLVHPEQGRERQRFVFRLSYRGRAVTLLLREGFVTAEFLELAGRQTRTPEQERRLTELKKEMATLVMSAAAANVYDVASDG